METEKQKKKDETVNVIYNNFTTLSNVNKYRTTYIIISYGLWYMFMV